MLDDGLVSLAAHRPRRRKSHRDVLPQYVPSQPLPELRTPSPSLVLDTAPEADTTVAQSQDNQSPHTRRNIFGLLRRYFGKLPSTDPDEHVTLADMSSPSATDTLSQPFSGQTQPQSKWWPFPNKNSFLLGNWHWNGGLQKSQSEFKGLIDIVGDPSFNPDDICKANWSKIFSKLGDSDAHGDDTDGEWMDVDAGWKKTCVDISIPFHRQMENPGTSKFIGVELHHRSLVEVIKERISDPHTAAQFHLEPYELLWKPTPQHNEIKIHGEIYTSEAFREAHNGLQNTPPEPNCDMPRVVAALMFWSDATHLTQFGSSQLWPCYMFLGNESKYRRCNPSCNLCIHVAYFQKVSTSCGHFVFSPSS